VAGFLEDKVTKIIVACRDCYKPGTPNGDPDEVSPRASPSPVLHGTNNLGTILAGGGLGASRGAIMLAAIMRQVFPIVTGAKLRGW